MSKEDIGNQQAFPCTYQGENGLTSSGGLTKREYFAAMALQGFLAAPDLLDNKLEGIIKLSVVAADELINELNKQ